MHLSSSNPCVEGSVVFLEMSEKKQKSPLYDMPIDLVRLRHRSYFQKPEKVDRASFSLQSFTVKNSTANIMLLSGE